jgi:uncharacterized YigZ family protein
MEKLIYTTISDVFQYEIPKIKWSRFITTLFPVHSKEEIDERLNEMKKKYYDATHNCYAWRLGVDANQDLFWNWIISSHQERANDDWEPSNTAWKPILNVLSWKAVFNILAVITRYFWGTLLWVWWLIQAYTEWTKQTLENCNCFIQEEICKTIEIEYWYEQVSIVQYLFSKYETKIISENYDNSINQVVSVNRAIFDIFLKELKDKQILYK